MPANADKGYGYEPVCVRLLDDQEGSGSWLLVSNSPPRISIVVGGSAGSSAAGSSPVVS